MTTDIATSAAFTGHRTYMGMAADALQTVVEELYERGVRTFMSGMAVGFDLAAAETVLALRGRLPELRLVCAVPFAGQQCSFHAVDRERFQRILAAADEVRILSDRYFTGCFLRRDDYLVDHASVIVAWYNGSPGGTHYTVRRARKRSIEVINLCCGKVNGAGEQEQSPVCREQTLF